MEGRKDDFEEAALPEVLAWEALEDDSLTAARGAPALLAAVVFAADLVVSGVPLEEALRRALFENTRTRVPSLFTLIEEISPEGSRCRSEEMPPFVVETRKESRGGGIEGPRPHATNASC